MKTSHLTIKSHVFEQNNACSTRFWWKPKINIFDLHSENCRILYCDRVSMWLISGGRMILVSLRILASCRDNEHLTISFLDPAYLWFSEQMKRNRHESFWVEHPPRPLWLPWPKLAVDRQLLWWWGCYSCCQRWWWWRFCWRRLKGWGSWPCCLLIGCWCCHGRCWAASSVRSSPLRHCRLVRKQYTEMTPVIIIRDSDNHFDCSTNNNNTNGSPPLWKHASPLRGCNIPSQWCIFLSFNHVCLSV